MVSPDLKFIVTIRKQGPTAPIHFLPRQVLFSPLLQKVNNHSAFEKQLITGEECITAFIFSLWHSSRSQKKTLAFIKTTFQGFGSSGINTAQSRRIDFY